MVQMKVENVVIYVVMEINLRKEFKNDINENIDDQSMKYLP